MNRTQYYLAWKPENPKPQQSSGIVVKNIVAILRLIFIEEQRSKYNNKYACVRGRCMFNIIAWLLLILSLIHGGSISLSDISFISMEVDDHIMKIFLANRFEYDGTWKTILAVKGIRYIWKLNIQIYPLIGPSPETPPAPTTIDIDGHKYKVIKTDGNGVWTQAPEGEALFLL